MIDASLCLLCLRKRLHGNSTLWLQNRTTADIVKILVQMISLDDMTEVTNDDASSVTCHKKLLNLSPSINTSTPHYLSHVVVRGTSNVSIIQIQIQYNKFAILQGELSCEYKKFYLCLSFTMNYICQLSLLCCCDLHLHSEEFCFDKLGNFI